MRGGRGSDRDVSRSMVALVATVAAAAALGVFGGRQATATADEHADHQPEVSAPVAAQQQAGLPPSGSTAAARLAASKRHAEYVTIRVGATDSVAAWVVYPERSDKAPVVIAIHDNTGLSTWPRTIADQLAADGFIGIAPDLLSMKRKGNLHTEWSLDSVRAALSSVTVEEGNRLLDAVARYGMALPAALPKYGVVGFCWGGGRSFQHAVHAPALGAAVIYYGDSPTAEQLASVKAPVLGLYAGNDARINARIPATDSTMKRLGKSYEVHFFEGAGHGFLKSQESAAGANQKASEQAWPLTIAFFKKHLGA